MQLCVYVYGDDNIFYMMLVYIVVNRLGVMEKKVWWWLALLCNFGVVDPVDRVYGFFCGSLVVGRSNK